MRILFLFLKWCGNIGYQYTTYNFGYYVTYFKSKEKNKLYANKLTKKPNFHYFGALFSFFLWCIILFNKIKLKEYFLVRFTDCSPSKIYTSVIYKTYVRVGLFKLLIMILLIEKR